MQRWASLCAALRLPAFFVVNGVCIHALAIVELGLWKLTGGLLLELVCEACNVTLGIQVWRPSYLANAITGKISCITEAPAIGMQ